MVTVALREGTPLDGAPVTRTVYVPLVAKLQDNVDVTDVMVELRVGWAGCKLQDSDGVVEGEIDTE